MTLAPLQLREAKDSLAKASTPEPFSASRTSNWVARLGGLPDYIQHVAHGILRSDPAGGESGAIRKAIGVVKNWASGVGKHVDENTRAAARKALAEWEKLKGENRAKVKEAWVEEADRYVASWEDERKAIDGALLELALFERTVGQDGIVGLLAEAALVEAVAWQPTLRRTASAPEEVDRHEVYDGAQHVGTISRRRAFNSSDPDRFAAFAINGQRVTDYQTRGRAEALRALQSHLEEAPARVIALPTAGKFLVAQPSAYSGETTYKQFSTEATARHAAGLPAAPTVPERNGQVGAVAEALRFDLSIVGDVPPLARLREAAAGDAFELWEAFHADEARGLHGRWVGRGATRAIDALSRDSRLPRRSLPAVVTPGAVPKARPGREAARYEGGVTRASARARAAHARKPQIGLPTDKRPEKALAASIGEGKWSRSAAQVSRRLLAQPQLGMSAIEKGVKAGTVLDTETAHRTGRNGAYSPERKALHEQIISNLLQGKGVHEGTARAVFTAGGGASGKSAMIASGVVKVPHDAVLANPDVIREMLPEYKALKAAQREDAASLTHEEASHIAKAVTRLALARQHHLLIDGVGDSGPGKFAGKIRAAQAAGHRVSVHYATVPTAEAIRRSDIRGQKTGRYVDHGVLRNAHAEVSKRFGEVAKIKGVHLQVFDTGQGTKAQPAPPKLLAEHHGQPDKLVIRDRPGFQGFLDKAKG